MGTDSSMLFLVHPYRMAAYVSVVGSSCSSVKESNSSNARLLQFAWPAAASTQSVIAEVTILPCISRCSFSLSYFMKWLKHGRLIHHSLYTQLFYQRPISFSVLPLPLRSALLVEHSVPSNMLLKKTLRD